MDRIKVTKVGSVVVKNVVCTDVTLDNASNSDNLHHTAYFKFGVTSGVPGRLLQSISELFPHLSLLLSDEYKDELYATGTVHCQTTIYALKDIDVPCVTTNGLLMTKKITSGAVALSSLLHDSLVFRASVNLVLSGVVVYETTQQEDTVGVVSFSSVKVSETGSYRPWVIIGTCADKSQFDNNHTAIMCKLNEIRTTTMSENDREAVVITGG